MKSIEFIQDTITRSMNIVIIARGHGKEFGKEELISQSFLLSYLGLGF